MKRPSPLLLFVALAFLQAAPLAGQRPLSLSVGPPAAGWPAQVRVGALLDDPGLRGALDSALPLRFHLRVELWRRGTLDQLVAAQEVSLAVLHDPVAGNYSVESPGVTHTVATLRDAQATLAQLLQVQMRPRQRGRHYYLATLVVETLSLSDIDELRRWLRGEVAPAIEGRTTGGRAVERGLRRLFVRLIGLPTRRYEARTETFDTG
jgi:hypothetical protein